MLAKAFLAVVQIDTGRVRVDSRSSAPRTFLPTIAVAAAYRKIIPVNAADGVNRILN